MERFNCSDLMTGPLAVFPIRVWQCFERLKHLHFPRMLSALLMTDEVVLETAVIEQNRLLFRAFFTLSATSVF